MNPHSLIIEIYLSKSLRVAFATEAAYADQRARLVAWGAANGEAISFNETTGEIVVSNNINFFASIYKNQNNMALIIIVISSLVVISFVSIFMVLRKKKRR